MIVNTYFLITIQNSKQFAYSNLRLYSNFLSTVIKLQLITHFTQNLEGLKG